MKSRSYKTFRECCKQIQYTVVQRNPYIINKDFKLCDLDHFQDSLAFNFTLEQPVFSFSFCGICRFFP